MVKCRDDASIYGMGVSPMFGRAPRMEAWARSRCAALLMLSTAIATGCASQPTQATKYPATRPSLAVEDVIKRFEIDDRLTLCHIQQRPNGSLVGEVEMPQQREVLRAHGFDVSGIKVLPEESSTPDRFAVVTAEHAILRKSPKNGPGDRENVTDLLQGETCWVLDRNAEGWTLVHSGDGYIGWAEPKTIDCKLDAEHFRLQATQARAAATQFSTPVGFTSPAQLITGLDVQPSTGIDESLRDAQATHARYTRELAISEAQMFLGTPYVWGGKTTEGIDCSGLTQTAYARHGVLLPRDADQQANVGRLVATRYFTAALLRGDLLFFMSPKRGNIMHVALYLGEGKYIEAAGKDVHISSMRLGDREYDAKRAGTFAWARRVVE